MDDIIKKISFIKIGVYESSAKDVYKKYILSEIDILNEMLINYTNIELINKKIDDIISYMYMKSYKDATKRYILFELNNIKKEINELYLNSK